MKTFAYRCASRHLILVSIVAGAFALCSMTMVAATAASEDLSVPEFGRPGPVGLSVAGASAGITTDYFEQTVIESLVASDIFSGIDDSKTTKIVLPMIGADGVFPGVTISSDAPYFLRIRVIKVDTPSFSMRMTVGMNVIWALYRTADNATLLHENVFSTYTGGVFEGGFIGADRVRAAMEGAERENIRIGMEMLESLGLEKQSGVNSTSQRLVSLRDVQ